MEKMLQENIDKTALDYAKLIRVDMTKKLEPINKSVDDMLARLEEFQTMVYLAQQERSRATTLLSSVLANNEDLSALFHRIDAVENLVDHVKCNLQTLEENVEKAEEELGCPESKTSKVANIFTPLFKKTSEKKSQSEPMEFFNTSDYFQ